MSTDDKHLKLIINIRALNISFLLLLRIDLHMEFSFQNFMVPLYQAWLKTHMLSLHLTTTCMIYFLYLAPCSSECYRALFINNI